jgi:hypothetical protein
MSQKILGFRINREKYAALQDICRRLGIEWMDVARKDYGQKLGTLAGVKGFVRDNPCYHGSELPGEMLVFAGMNSAQVDAFLAEYKKTGLVPISLKAVVTPDNVFWSADTLFHELMREHMSFGNNK